MLPAVVYLKRLPLPPLRRIVERVEARLDSARLLAATVASARHRRLDHGAVGLTLEQTTDVITPELARAYAEATRDPNPRYDQGLAPPFLIVRLVLPLIREAMVHPRLRLNILRMVHAEQEMSWSSPLRVGERDLRVSLTVSAIEETRAGELVRLEGDARRADGELVGTARVGLMVRGPRRDSTTGPKRAREEREQPPESFRIPLPTECDQALRYAAASGDTNFIHTSEVLARLAGLPRTILHGMCVMAMASGAIVRERLGGDLERCSSVRVRFSSPAFPGETLTVVGYQGQSEGQLPFEVQNQRGKAVIRNGLLVTRE
jgi:acyl dehydratase